MPAASLVIGELQTNAVLTAALIQSTLA